MAGNYRFPMDQKDIVRLLSTTVGSFIQDQLINKEQRTQHKEQCAERLAAEDESCDKATEVRYSDQAVLANLDWGIEALEEAINTSNMETKLARLDHAEKMLQVCAMLSSGQKTAGVPNFYLSAWAHLNLSYLWKLRNNIHNSVHHVLEMFIVDPFFSRIDFAPDLWKILFLPHMSSIVGWYSEARHRILMDVIPDSADLSLTADLDQFFNDSLIFTLRPDQKEKMQNLEQLYGESFDENTRLYAKYYKDCMDADSNSGKKVIPMMPIAESPVTPLHELSRSVPDYVKFGPILPKSAGFSLMHKSKKCMKEVSRMTATSPSSQNMKEPSTWDPQDEGFLDENENDSDYEADDTYTESEVISHNLVTVSGEDESEPIVQASKRSTSNSPTIFSHISSRQIPSPKSSSPKLDTECTRDETSLLRLLSNRIIESSIPTSLPVSPHSDDYTNSAESEETTICSGKKRSPTLCMSYDDTNTQVLENSPSNGTDEGSHSYISFPLSEKLTPRSRPPKDFVCPITGQIFNDPVTLETGQTYERKAIQEWVKRGNTTCPITRQPLSASILPKTNYVLKRLITSWKEQYPDLALEFSYCETPRSSFSSPSKKGLSLSSAPSRAFGFPSQRSTNDLFNLKCKRFMRMSVSTSPTSVISQAALETIINGLKPLVSCLCTSEDLKECESAVLAITKIWMDSKADSGIQAYLSDATIINGLVEILSASLNREVLKMSIYILSELIFADESVGEILTSVDSDFDCLAALLKNGLNEAAVLIYQLRPTFAQISAHDFVPSLVQIIVNKYDELDGVQLVIEPTDAAIAMIDQILVDGDENARSFSALTIISADGIPALVKRLDKVEGRWSIVSILLCCIRTEKSCRNLIASRIELSSVLELFHAGNDSAKGTCIEFLSELVQLERRTFCNQILQILKEEGSFSTMHAFLVYLQMAPIKQQPAVATLLLQLDLLVEPRKMSIYREEAIEALIEALFRKEFPTSQTMALEALLSLSGHLTASGKSCTEAWLLKVAGFDLPYNALMKAEQSNINGNRLMEIMEEQRTAASWGKKVAFVLCNHEKGSIFKALEECLKSDSIEIANLCLVVATWLTHMLNNLPDTGVRNAARKCLLDQFINVLQSSKNLEEKILATLALRTFVSDPAALEELGVYARCIYKTLRNLKKHSVVVTDILKALMNLPSVDARELWTGADPVELHSCMNGEVLSLVYVRGRVLSSHSDGTIKVWDTGKRNFRLIQEVREHTKAVTCLHISNSDDKLYSGSLDKKIRVWAIKPEEIHCLQVHDVKEAVYELYADANAAYFISHGTGVKVYNWSGVPKHINFNKYVKSLSVTGNKLYCGFSGYGIQEVDLCTFASNIFYSGTRKLLGKQSIHSLHIQDGFLFAGGSSVDGIAGKVFSLSTKAVVGSFSTGSDIQHVAVNNDFIFTSTKSGTIEVWLKERVTRIASLKPGNAGHAKITSILSDPNGGMLFAGSSDGKIQAWTLD